jgi:hypothetical protein
LSRELDPVKIEASLKDGVLRLHIPKAEEATPRRIDVKVAGSGDPNSTSWRMSQVGPARAAAVSLKPNARAGVPLHLAVLRCPDHRSLCARRQQRGRGQTPRKRNRSAYRTDLADAVRAAQPSLRATPRHPVAAGLRCRARDDSLQPLSACPAYPEIAMTLLPRTRRILAAALALGLAGAFATRSAQAAPDAAFQSAFQHFASASAGDSAEVNPAADAFEALLKAEPANPVLMAYAGASTSLKASTTLLPMKKMSYAEDGLALLDKSLALLTAASDAKFVAANTFLAVPGFMNRGARGAKLLTEVLESPLFAKAPLPFKGQVWMRAAALAAKERRAQDARRYLNEVITQGAPQAEAAKAKVKEIAA